MVADLILVRQDVPDNTSRIVAAAVAPGLRGDHRHLRSFRSVSIDRRCSTHIDFAHAAMAVLDFTAGVCAWHSATLYSRSKTNVEMATCFRLTKRCSQPLAVAMTSLPFMKAFTPKMPSVPSR